MHSLLILVMAFSAVELSRAEMRWCDLYNGTRYDDALLVCMTCQDESKLILKSSVQNYRCCRGRVSTLDECFSVLSSLEMNQTETCTSLSQCDGKKQCYNASDELGCDNCPYNSLTCNNHSDGPKCVPLRKVCDSEKDCEGGKDETLCPYYKGWCRGYLCGGSHPRCIDESQICDKHKDCLDGSDETNCQYCLNQFRCRVFKREDINATSAECIGKFRVCDGNLDCSNGADEINCYRWREWSPWSQCHVPATCHQSRNRECVSRKNKVVHSSYCHSVDDYDVGAGDINREIQLQTCQECLTTAPIETTTSTQAETTATTRETTVETTKRYTTPILITKDLHQETTSPPGTSKPVVFRISTGIVVAIVAFVTLLLLAGVLIIFYYYVRYKRKTGKWRPPRKLPPPAQSHLPMVYSKPKKYKKKRVRPEISNPYPIKTVDETTLDMNGKRQSSLKSTGGNGIDSGIEECHSNTSHEVDASRRRNQRSTVF